MAKRPTIRLKKTELPIDAVTALYQASCTQAQFLKEAQKLLTEFHTVERGQNMPGSPRFKGDFDGAFTDRSATLLKVYSNFQISASRRLIDCASTSAPWIWKERASTGGPDFFITRKTSVETFCGESNVTPFRFEIQFQGKVFDHAVPVEARTIIDEQFKKSKQIRALKRYVARINLDCVRMAVPAFFSVDYSPPQGRRWDRPGWEGDRIFCPNVVVQVQFVKTWLTDMRYNASSLLIGNNCSTIPAEYDLERAAEGFRGNNSVLFLRTNFNEQLAFQITTPAGPKIASAAWVNELLSGTNPTPEDIRSGKALIPPKAELVSVTTLLEKVPEMKRIIRTLMRIARPYDHASFCPTDL